MKPFYIQIATPDGLEFDGQVESLLVRTDDGDIEILCGHADYISSLGTGRARLLIDGKPRYAAINGGFLSVKEGKVKLVSITFEFADQIDLNRAKEAKEKAEAAIQSAKDEREEAAARAKLLRAVSRINVAGLK